MLAYKQTQEITPVKKRKRREKHNWVMLGFAFFFATLLVIVQQTIVVGYGYDLAKAKNKIEVISLQNDELNIEIARLKAHPRIFGIATNNLGMIIPKDKIYAQR